MADARFEEAIRLAFQTDGTEGIKQAAQIIANMGDVSEETRKQAAAMLDAIAANAKTDQAITQFDKLGRTLVETQRQLTEGRARIVELARAMAASESPTRAQQRALDDARKAVSDLYAAQQKQLGQYRELKASLDAQGISTRSVAAAEQSLNAMRARSTEQVQALVRSIQQEQAAQAEAAVKAERASQEAAQAELTRLAEQQAAEQAAQQAALAAGQRMQAQLQQNALQAARFGDALKKAYQEAGGELTRSNGLLGTAQAGSMSAESLERSAKALQDFLDQTKDEINRLQAVHEQLVRANASTEEMATSQALLANRSRQAAQAVAALTAALRAQSEAEAASQRELEVEAARKKAQQAEYAESVRRTEQRVRELGGAERAANEDAGHGIEHTNSLLLRMKYILESVSVYFSGRAIINGIKAILGTGDQFAKYQQQLASLYGTAAQGQQAFDWVKQFAKTTPLQLSDVMQNFIQLKNFGIDPMNGALQAAVDQNAKLGGESERLTRITLAMGQAFARGKLEGQDILQMIEAGVPVWQLLSDATGKTTGELQKMSAAGQLGADVMQRFFAQMGKEAQGASAQQMSLLSGQWSNFMDNVQQFEDRIAKSGALQWFRDQLDALNKKISEMAGNGQLDAYAKRVSAAIVGLASTLKSAVSFVIDHAKAIKDLALAYAGLKILGVASEFLRFGTVLLNVVKAGKATASALEGIGTTGRIVASSLALLANPVGLVIAALTAFALAAWEGGKAITDFALKNSDAARQLEESDQRYRDNEVKWAAYWGKRVKALEEFRDVELLSAEQVAKLTAGQLAEYQKALAGHAKYAEANEKYTEAVKHAVANATEAQIAAAADAEAALNKSLQAQKDYAEGVGVAQRAAASNISLGAQTIIDAITKVVDDTDQLNAQISGLFQNFGRKTIDQMADVALALVQLGKATGQVGEQIRTGIASNLNQLTSKDLLAFQQASNLAFVQFGTSASNAAQLVNLTLQSALEKLGVAATQWGLATTEAAEQNVAAFQTVAENANASAATIEAAFNKAVANADTIQSVQALGDAMQQAANSGKVGFDAVDRSVQAVQNRINALRDALDPLNNAFDQLGIKSRQQLEDTAAAARSAFNEIYAAYQKGKASIEDVRAAFGPYAAAQQAAVANSDVWKRNSVNNALEVQASVLNVTASLNRMGRDGDNAGDEVAGGAHRAARALDDTASAANDAADATSDASDSVSDYGDDAKDAGDKSADAANKSADAWVASGQRTQVALGGLSDAFTKALFALNAKAGNVHAWAAAWNATVADWQRQTDSLNRELTATEAQNASYDELTKRVNNLRRAYKYLNDEQLRSLAQAQMTLEENRKEAADKAKQAHDALLQKLAQDDAAQTAQWNKELGLTGEGGSGAPRGPRRPPLERSSFGDAAQVHRVEHHHVIELKVSPDKTPGAVAAVLSPTDLQTIATHVVRQIGISRSRSNSR